MEYPVITLWNPWAIWIAKGWKTIETRTHKRFASLEAKWVGIHAGLKWDDTALTMARGLLSMEKIKQTENFLRIGGAIICLAHVKEHRLVGHADSIAAIVDCKVGPKRWGLVIDEIKPIEAIPVKGKQGIWHYEIPPNKF